MDHLERELAGIRAELARLAERIYSLDRAVRSAPADAPASPASGLESRPSPPPPPRGVEIRIEAPRPETAPGAKPAPSGAQELQEVRREALTRLTAPRSPAPPPEIGAPSIAPDPVSEPVREIDTKKEAWSFERMIGAKAFAAAGAMIVVLGASFFLKLAIDQGWVRAIPPAVRCGAVAAFGGLLIALGETARRRISTLASTGLSSAGIAIVYASVYGAREMFGLIGEPAAMVMLMGVTAGGIGLGVVGRRLFLAILSVVGAYLAPVLLATEAPSPVFFPSYLVALLVVGLVLGGWIGGKFRSLRSITWWGTMVLGTGWILGWAMDSGPMNGLMFVGVVWSLTHVELVVSARFFRDERDTETTRVPWMHARWLMSSFGATTWTLAFGIALLRSIGTPFDELAPALLGVGMAIVALVTTPNPVAALRGPRSARGQLSTAMVAQIGAMAIAVIALALTGWSQAMAWVALGAAAAIAGSRIGIRSVFVYGALVVAIGTTRIFVIDWAPWVVGLSDGPEVWATVWGVELGPVWAQLAASAIGWLVCAACARPRRADAGVFGAIGVACAMVSVLSPNVEPGGIAAAWGAVGAIAMVASRFLGIPILGVMGVGPVLGASVAWMVAFGEPRVWERSVAPVLMSAGLTRGAALGACAALGAGAMRPQDRRRIAIAVMGIVVGVVMLIATSLEVHRMAGIWSAGDLTARRAAVSMWWAIVGLGAVGFGTIRQRPWSRWIGLALLGAAAAKLVVFDLIEISTEWRVVGSMVIGLILLGVAVGYARAIRRERDREAQDGSTRPA